MTLKNYFDTQRIAVYQVEKKKKNYFANFFQTQITLIFILCKYMFCAYFVFP